MKRRTTSGYTLPEIMVASTISLMVGAAAITVLITGMRSSLRATSVSANDITQWHLDSRLWVDSKTANGISVYEDYTADKVEPWLRTTVESRGNLLVLSLSEPADSGKKISYKKINGYQYIRAEKTIYRFEYTVPTEDQDEFTPLEKILTQNMEEIKNSYVVQARDATPLSNAGVFICRSPGKAASLSCHISAGVKSNQTEESKLIEATFIVRN